MGTNMYPSSSLLGENHGEGSSDLPHVDELIENADGFAGVFPGNYDPNSILIHIYLCHVRMSINYVP